MTEAKPLFKACSALKCRISFYKQEVSGWVYLQQSPHSGKQKKSWLLCFLVFLVIVAVHGCAQISASLWDQDRVGPAKEMGGKSDEARSPGWVGYTVLYDVQKAGVAKKKKKKKKKKKREIGQGVLGDFSVSTTPTQLWPPLSLLWNLTQLYPTGPHTSLQPAEPPHISQRGGLFKSSIGSWFLSPKTFQWLPNKLTGFIGSDACLHFPLTLLQPL